MTRRKHQLSETISDQGFRSYVHAAILLAGATCILAGALGWGIFHQPYADEDKLLHYQGGKFIAAGVFYCVYLSIIIRVLLVGREKGSLTKVLLWLPAMLAVGMFAAFAVVILIGVFKEALDLGGLGTVERFDIDATLDGALDMVTPVAIIMALTPILIPADMLMQLPKLMLSDVTTGMQTLDGYLKEKKVHAGSGRSANVLVVEDDLTCAATIMNFCRMMGLTCHHVTTIADAKEYLDRRLANIRLITLDNFVGIDDFGGNMTGSQWLLQMDASHPKGKRKFAVVMISGHTEFLGQAAQSADLVLQKPWDPRQLLAFLRERGIITQKGSTPC